MNPSPDIIRIGRLHSCEIHIEDNSLSKYQANISYDPEKGWILMDGYEGRQSTNGTWLYLSDNYSLYDGMVFKAHQTLLKVFRIR